VRDAIATGLARGPRMIVSASPLTVTGGHCWFMGAEADTEDDLRRMVHIHHKNGADLIKVMSTGGFMTTGSAPWHAQFTTLQLSAVVQEARRVDKPVAAHAHGIEGIRRAVEAGVTTLEHCSFVTETNERCFDESLAVQITGRLAPGYEADLIVVDGDPRADIAVLGKLRRVIARGRDYVPDSGRFDVSAPGTPFASAEQGADLLIIEATRRRPV
jgi:imidazolonepropionase-like amidohydrolase